MISQKDFSILNLFRILLNMDIELASKIVSLRPAIEALMIRCTQDPNNIVNRPQPMEQLCNLIRLLSDQQLEHIFCEKINENNDTTPPADSNFRYDWLYSISDCIIDYICINVIFSISSAEPRPNQLFPSSRGHNQRPFHSGRNRQFFRQNYRGHHPYSQSYQPQHKYRRNILKILLQNCIYVKI